MEVNILEKYFNKAKEYNRNRYGIDGWEKRHAEYVREQEKDPTKMFVNLSCPQYYAWEDTVVALMFQLEELLSNSKVEE